MFQGISEAFKGVQKGFVGVSIGLQGRFKVGGFRKILRDLKGRVSEDKGRSMLFNRDNGNFSSVSIVLAAQRPPGTFLKFHVAPLIPPGIP